MRRISLLPEAFDHFDFWLRNDRKVLIRILELVRDIHRDPFGGIGKPESLKHELKGLWSRRITQEHRLVYSVSEDEIVLVSCRFHYGK